MWKHDAVFSAEGGRLLRQRIPSTAGRWAFVDFTSSVADASASRTPSFASGINRHRLAVRAAITEPWSNEQTEGQITSCSWSSARCKGEESST